MKLAVQDVAYRYFQRKPEMKSKVAQLITNTLAAINERTTNFVDFQAILKDQVGKLNLTPPEQEFMFMFVNDMSLPVTTYFNKDSLSGVEQIMALKEVLGWILDMTKY